ncbi:MAG: ABC transporter ATP-binding protein [Planctomycetota bacterium]
MPQEKTQRVPLSKAFKRFAPYVWRYKGRALLVLLLGLTAGFLAKAPLLLLGIFVDKGVGLKTDTSESLPADSTFLGKFNGWVEFLREQVVILFPGLSGEGPNKNQLSLVVAIACAIIFLTVMGALAQLVFVQMSRWLSMRILADLREALASHVLKLGMRYHTASRKGDLLSRLTTDVNVVLVALSLFFDDLILEPANLVGAFIIAVVSNPELTLLVIIIVPTIVVPLLVFGKKIRKGMRKSLVALGESTEAMSQMFSGIRVVKAFRMEERELNEFRESNEHWISRYMVVVRAKALTEASTHIFTNVGFALLLCGIAVLQVYYGEKTNVGKMVIWFSVFGTMYQHLRRISKGYQTIQESLGAAERLFEVLDLKPGATMTSVATKKLSEPIRTLELRNVTFAYDEELVLDHVSFEAKAGETIAIVGPSGSGKSTLLDLIGRFNDPDSGNIYVNGTDINEIDPDEWFRAWALVDQQPFLFHASIRENVAYGKPDATDAEVRSALKDANLLEFVDALPAGMNTEVGDRGARLSGGQRQRITIARALLKNPSILLLDEVTSALDAESETAVFVALDRLMAGRTSIVVAHRLSTIRSATRILVIDRGKLVEQGTHDELLRLGGAYKRFYEMQFGSSFGQ